MNRYTVRSILAHLQQARQGPANQGKIFLKYLNFFQEKTLINLFPLTIYEVGTEIKLPAMSAEEKLHAQREIASNGLNYFR